MLRMEKEHFWFGARRRLLGQLVSRFVPVPGPFAELGCGSGALAASLSRLGYAVDAVDGHPHGPDRLAAEFPQRSWICGAVENTPWQSAAYSGVGLFDVLEHVEEEPVLAEAHRLLRPGAHLLVSVPAYPWLYSEFDRRAGHLRRYTRKMLTTALRHAGFAPVFSTAYQCLLFPLVVLQRWRQKANEEWRLPPRPLNRLLGWVNALEVRFSAHHSLPFGSSLLCVAQRR